MPSTVNIRRQGAGAYFNRPVEVHLNDQLLSAVRSGDQESFEVAPGEYRLQAQAGSCRSLELVFQIKEGESLQFILSERSINKAMLPLMIGFVGLQLVNLLAKPRGVEFPLFMLVYSLFTLVMVFLVYFRKEGFFEWQQEL